MPPGVEGFHWPPGIEDKIYARHSLEPEEVEEAFFYRGSRVRRFGERYLLFSRTEAGKYIIVVYAQSGRIATVISARGMTSQERRLFRRK